jgi:hypothetical protein
MSVSLNLADRTVGIPRQRAQREMKSLSAVADELLQAGAVKRGLDRQRQDPGKADALVGAWMVVLMLAFEQWRTTLGRGPAFDALFWRALCRPRVSWMRDMGESARSAVLVGLSRSGHRRRAGHRSGHGQGHSACQDAAVASTDDFLAVVGTVAYVTVAYVTSGCAHDPGIFGCPKLLQLYTPIHGR